MTIISFLLAILVIVIVISWFYLCGHIVGCFEKFPNDFRDKIFVGFVVNMLLAWLASIIYILTFAIHSRFGI